MRGAPISSCPVHIAGRGTLVVQVVRVGEKSFLKQVARHIEEACPEAWNHSTGGQDTQVLRAGRVEVEADLEQHVVEVAFANKEMTAEGVKEILTEIGFKPA